MLSFLRSSILALFLTVKYAGITLAAPIYLQVDGVSGNVADEDYLGAIAIASMSIGGEHMAEGAGSNGSTTFYSLFATTTGASHASPLLWQGLAAGTNFDEVKLSVIESSPFGNRPIIEFELDDARIVFYTIENPSLNEFRDVVAFDYTQITFTYISYDAAGSRRKTSASWNVELGTPIGTFAFVATEPNVPGDFDDNGVANGNDLLAWQRGASPSPLSPDDVNEWRENFGNNSAELLAGTTVPEPSGLTLCTLVLANSICSRKNH